MVSEKENQFWILDEQFDYECENGITFESGRESLVVNGKQHSSLFNKPESLSIARSVRKKANSDAFLLYHGGTRVIFISERLKVALSEMRATGFELLPAVVKLGDVKGFIEVPYFQLLINGWGGIALAESGVLKIQHERLGLWRYSDPTDCSRIVDPAQYDGSDFFRVWPMPGSIFVTCRVKRLFEEMQVKNCRFESLEKRFGSPKLTLRGMVPAPLSLYYRPERAREVGAQYGIDWFEC